MNHVTDMRFDYDLLGALLADEKDGTRAAALARERRMIRVLLEALEKPPEVPLVDQLADRRRSRTKTAGAADRRRKPG